MKQYEYIAVDFDGTLCVHRFPEIGEPNPGVIEYIKKQAAAGTKIILHTCRENDEADGRRYLDEAVEWCKAHKIPIAAVNENPFVTFGGRKIYADIYIDDRAVNVNEIQRVNVINEPEKQKAQLTDCSVDMDKHWEEVLKLAEKYGFILQAAGGAAILATHQNQLESRGLSEYKRIQKMNGHCPKKYGYEPCVDLNGEHLCNHCSHESVTA